MLWVQHCEFWLTSITIYIYLISIIYVPLFTIILYQTSLGCFPYHYSVELSWEYTSNPIPVRRILMLMLLMFSLKAKYHLLQKPHEVWMKIRKCCLRARAQGRPQLQPPRRRTHETSPSEFQGQINKIQMQQNILCLSDRRKKTTQILSATHVAIRRVSGCDPNDGV